MLEEAINYPRSGDEALKTILIGGVLTLLSVLFLPIFLVLGYEVRVIRSTLDGEEMPPVFDDWGAMFVDGLKAFAIGLVYLIIPLIIVGISFGGVLASAFAGDGNIGAAAIAGAFAGLSLAALLFLVIWYVLPAGLSNFVRKDSMSAAFAYGDLRQVLFSTSYAKAWLLALVVVLAAGIIASLLNVVPFLGFVVGAFVQFYAGMAAYRLYAQGYDQALPGEPGPEMPSGQPAA